MFGTATNCPQSVLPRRTVVPRKCSKTGLAAFQRVQRQQKAEVDAESVEDAPDLKAIMDKAEADTRTKKQESLQKTLAEAVNAKLQLLNQANFKADAAERLAKLSAEDAKRKSLLDAMVLRDLRKAGELDAGRGVAVCILAKGDLKEADSIIKRTGKILQQLCGLKVYHMTSANLVDKALSASFVIWLGVSKTAESSLLTSAKEPNSGTPLSTWLSRFIGGYVAGPSWLQECQQRQKLLAPVLRLAPVCAIQRQICFDASLTQRTVILKTLASIELHTAGYRLWTIRVKREELSKTELLVIRARERFIVEKPAVFWITLASIIMLVRSKKTAWLVVGPDFPAASGTKHGKVMTIEHFLNSITTYLGPTSFLVSNNKVTIKLILGCEVAEGFGVL